MLDVSSSLSIFALLIGEYAVSIEMTRFYLKIASKTVEAFVPEKDVIASQWVVRGKAFAAIG